MKKQSKILVAVAFISLMSPLSVYAVDACNVVFSTEASSEAQLKAKVESDLDYTLFKSGIKAGSLEVTMESATPENLSLLRELLAKWNLKFDDASYSVFKRDFLIVRDVLNVHDFKSITEILSNLNSNADIRLHELVLAARAKTELFRNVEIKATKKHEVSGIEKQAPSLKEALELGKIAAKKNWDLYELAENVSEAFELAKSFKAEGSQFTPALTLLSNERPNYLKELRVISTLELNYVYIPFFEGGKPSSEKFKPDIHDASFIVERAEELHRTPEQVVEDMKAAIAALGLDSGLVSSQKKIQFFDLLPAKP